MKNFNGAIPYGKRGCVVFYKKLQKIFQKPLDKWKICAIIKIQKKEMNKKC